MVITKEKGCAAISTMVAQPSHARRLLALARIRCRCPLLLTICRSRSGRCRRHRRDRHWRHRPLPNPEMSHWMRPPCTDGCTWGPCWNRCWPWSLAHWHHRGGAFGAGIIGIRVAVRGIAVRGVFAAIAWIHRVDDGVDELVDPAFSVSASLGICSETSTTGTSARPAAPVIILVASLASCVLLTSTSTPLSSMSFWKDCRSAGAGSPPEAVDCVYPLGV